MEKINFIGFDSTSSTNYYVKNGVRIHKPEFDSLWEEKKHGFQVWESNDWLNLKADGKWKKNAGLKYAEIVDEAGIVTDEFYGTVNDFDHWVVGFASRGKKFDINAFYHGVKYAVGKVATCFNGQSMTFEQEPNRTWSLVTSNEYHNFKQQVA